MFRIFDNVSCLAENRERKTTVMSTSLRDLSTTPAKQASLLIFEVFMDTFFVCTMSVLLVLVTGVWVEDMNPLLLVQPCVGEALPSHGCIYAILLVVVGVFL